jgi:hypothetical protein
MGFPNVQVVAPRTSPHQCDMCKVTEVLSGLISEFKIAAHRHRRS